MELKKRSFMYPGFLKKPYLPYASCSALESVHPFYAAPASSLWATAIQLADIYFLGYGALPPCIVAAQ